MTDKVQKIREEVERLQNELIQEKKKGFGSDVDDACILELQNVLTYIDSLQEEPVSEELGEYINKLSKQFPEVSFAKLSRIAVRVAKWQKEHNWKTADGDELPDIDREVIVLTQPYPLGENEYTVSFAHRPDPNGWDGKSVTTGKVEHYTPKTYGKGGWNIPDVKYWLDVELPKEIKL